MKRLMERLVGNDQKIEQSTDNKPDENTSINLSDIIEQEAHYEIDEDDKKYLDNINKFENQKARLWTKPDFQSHLKVFTKLKYNKDLTTEKISSYRVYKKLYNDNIRNNKDVSLYEKLLFHPDLTQLDYEYIQQENRKVTRNAGMIQISSILGLGYCYFRTNLRQKRGFYAVFMMGPAFFLFGAFGLERYRFRRKLYKVELDKKYQIPAV